MAKYIQFRPGDVDANGLAPISAEIISFGLAPPECPNQIIVPDDTDTSGMMIDTNALQLVAASVSADISSPSTAKPAVVVDMAAEYKIVSSDGGYDYFVANFQKIG